MSQTITAIATPFGTGAVGVVRLSGTDALNIASQVFSTQKLDNFCNATPNFMYLGKLNCNNFYDSCLAVYFKAPHSFTGEDVVEFQCHGGARLLEEVISTLIANGAVLADKGEFTKRAFLNGKYSLSQAEGIIDMINSENTASLNAGYRQMSGHLNKKVENILSQILDITASLEASLDYPEELEEEVRENLPIQLNSVKIGIKKLLDTVKLGRIIKNGINVAIIGMPNIGKSSLLNCLLGKDRAIVTDIAGTTRDTLEERVEYKGIFINFIDTAGIRDTIDTIEKIGVDKALDSAKNADIILFMLNANKAINKEELELYNKFKDKPIIKVFNKADLGKDKSHKDGIFISAKNCYNINSILDKIYNYFIDGKVDSSGDVITNLRHIEALQKTFSLIDNACFDTQNTATECILIDLKSAYFELGKITGDTASEDIIDTIFSKFCLGK